MCRAVPEGRGPTETAEARFVRLFIRKNRQERLLQELTSPKKRYKGLDRFCHHSGDLLEPRRIALADGNLERLPAFQEFARAHAEACLICSPDPELDGQVLPFGEAVACAAFCADAVIVLGSDFAVVCGEAGKGGREKYLLTAERIAPAR